MRQYDLTRIPLTLRRALFELLELGASRPSSQAILETEELPSGSAVSTRISVYKWKRRFFEHIADEDGQPRVAQGDIFLSKYIHKNAKVDTLERLSIALIPPLHTSSARRKLRFTLYPIPVFQTIQKPDYFPDGSRIARFGDREVIVPPPLEISEERALDSGKMVQDILASLTPEQIETNKARAKGLTPAPASPAPLAPAPSAPTLDDPGSPTLDDYAAMMGPTPEMLKEEEERRKRITE
jgi:hypothetical protein